MRQGGRYLLYGVDRAVMDNGPERSLRGQSGWQANPTVVWRARITRRDNFYFTYFRFCEGIEQCSILIFNTIDYSIGGFNFISIASKATLIFRTRRHLYSYRDTLCFWVPNTLIWKIQPYKQDDATSLRSCICLSFLLTYVQDWMGFAKKLNMLSIFKVYN